jgi:hypothetical protein
MLTAISRLRRPPVPFKPHTAKVVLGGHINTVQTWSTGFWLTFSGFAGAAPSADKVAGDLEGNTDVNTMVDALWSSLSSFIARTCTFDSVRYTCYGEDTSTPSESLRSAATPGAGGSNNGLPPECATVASLHTSRPGGSYRGRMYLPLTGLAIGLDGFMQETNAQTTANAVAALFNSLNGHTFEGAPGGAGGYGVNVVVFSPKLGTTQPVTSVSVDTKVDVQRRREHKLIGIAKTHAVSS